jgi:hypothetical protein
MIYYRLSEQPKHVRDIGSIIVMSSDQIDWDYFYIWLEQLELQPVWAEVQAAVKARLQ